MMGLKRHLWQQLRVHLLAHFENKNITKVKKMERLEDLNKANLQELVAGIPFCQTLGIEVDYLGNEITTHLPFNENFIGNPAIPALHGGVIGAFLEITAITQLSWTIFLDKRYEERKALAKNKNLALNLPKTIDITIDYLHSGRPLECFARASINRVGNRYSSVSVMTWQTDPGKPFAKASGHFLIAKP